VPRENRENRDVDIATRTAAVADIGDAVKIYLRIMSGFANCSTWNNLRARRFFNL